MAYFTAWETWFHGNVIVILLVMALGFGLLLWMANRLISQHENFADKKEALEAEIESERKKVEDSEIAKLVIHIKELVLHIKVLFRKQDGHENRLDILERKVEGHLSKCNEREKIILGIKERQDHSIAKFDKALIDRVGDTKREDRTDREV